MTLDIAICDDNAEDCDRLNNMLTNCAFRYDHHFNISIFRQCKNLISSYTDHNHYDILFMDIEMPNENGIDKASYIKNSISHNVIIVFVSNYPEYMQDSFKVHPYFFIQKPVTATVIDKLICDILRDASYNKVLITVIDGYKNEYTVNINDIYYIETVDAKNKELSFHLKDHSINAKGILTSWNDKLREYAFHQCSRTILINLTHIHYFNNLQIVLDNNTTIPVSSRNKKQLMSKYLNKVVSVNNGGSL